LKKPRRLLNFDNVDTFHESMTDRIKLYKISVVSFIILCSISFFDLIVIPSAIIKGFEFIGSGIILLFIILHVVYGDKHRFTKFFTIEVVLIFSAVILSMSAAKIFHGQSFSVTFLAQRFMYYWLFYYLLHAMRINPEDLLKLIFAFGIAYCIIYILQTLAYPIELLHSKMFTDRNTLRIYMPGAGYLVLGYFIALSQYVITKQNKYLIYCFIAFIIFVLLGTRQVLATMALITLLHIYWSKKIKSKLFVYMLIGAATIAVFFLFQNIFLGMIEATEKQALQGQDEDDIRIRAAVYFLFEFFPNDISYITGNGVHSAHSTYGMNVEYVREALHFNQSDIGIIGDYSRFGLLFVIAELSILLRTAFIRVPEKFYVVKFNAISILLTMFVGKGAFGSSDNILVICMLLYITDLYLNEKFKTASSKQALHPATLPK
jgi:hypothetical protein